MSALLKGLIFNTDFRSYYAASKAKAKKLIDFKLQSNVAKGKEEGITIPDEP